MTFLETSLRYALSRQPQGRTHLAKGYCSHCEKIRDLDQGETTCWICGREARRLSTDEPVMVAVGGQRVPMTVEEAEMAMARGNKLVPGEAGGDSRRH